MNVKSIKSQHHSRLKPQNQSKDSDSDSDQEMVDLSEDRPVAETFEKPP